MKSSSALFFISILFMVYFSCGENDNSATYEVKKWEKLTLKFEGPATSETAEDNPFLNYRLLVTFMNGNDSIVIPGFYAADGYAAETSSEAGNSWQVRFRPHKEGLWKYSVSFRKGKDIAISDDLAAGEGISFDGSEGSIQVSASPNNQGRLIVSNGHYLKYADKEVYFLKGGADSPENFLAFDEFDGTYRGEIPEDRSGEATAAALHKYTPHQQDWEPGDPTWQNGKGKNIIGALNYLASKGMNSVYFLTMNIGGDGKDVWPYTGYDERLRYDCSKLDQWEIVFDHMDKLGLNLHVVTQETENETLLDRGNTTYERKLYYRELIARFAHHLGVTWNMGEENGPIHFSPSGQSTEQQKAMVQYIKTTDPYQNLVVIHSHHDDESKLELYEPLLGFSYLDGMSIQNGNPKKTNEVTRIWREKSAQAGKPWIMNIDEVGPAWRGTDPDDRIDNNQDTLRHVALWGNLMAGGAGIEWYFGYRNHNNDLQCEDWRSRARVWDFTRHALDFFHNYLPFHEMEPSNGVIQFDGSMAYCFSKEGDTYAIYLPHGGSCEIDLTTTSGTYSLQWYNPRSGGNLTNGSITEIKGGINQVFNTPDDDPKNDWVALIRKT